MTTGANASSAKGLHEAAAHQGEASAPVNVTQRVGQACLCRWADT